MPAPDSISSPLAARLERLYRRNLHAVKLGLEPTQALLASLGRPQDSFLAIHVAGTNGKGSVCAMLAAILRAAGLRTALYTSPHLVRFNERIRVNGVAITDDELAALIDLVDARAAEAAQVSGRDVTFFEFTTALAFEHFKRAGVQIAVIETGMGGRLDATNVIDPLVSVITSIGLDHTAFLGDTLEQIAAEKAGIIKPGRPVVLGELDEEARGVIGQTARRAPSTVVQADAHADVKRVRQDLSGQRIKIQTPGGEYGPVTLPLLGRHQLGNVAIAVTAIETIRDLYQLPLPDLAIADGLAAVSWPARFQVLSQEPPVILDGAHNPQAAETLAATLRELFKKTPVGLIAGFLADKDAAGILRPLSSIVRRAWMVAPRTERAMSVEQAQLAFRAAGLKAEQGTLAEALYAARIWAEAAGGVVCIAGSLYLASEVLADRPDG